MARALVALARDERTWGGVWHVPPVSDLSIREVAGRLAELVGLPAPDLVPMSEADLREAGPADPIIARMWETQYQYQRPCLLDATLTTRTFGLTATSLDEVLLRTAEAHPATRRSPLPVRAPASGTPPGRVPNTFRALGAVPPSPPHGGG